MDWGMGFGVWGVIHARADALVTPGEGACPARAGPTGRWRGSCRISFQAEDFVGFVDDGQAVGIAEGEFGIAEFSDFRFRSGEGVPVFLAVELEPFAFQLEPVAGMAAALEVDGIGDGQPQELEALRAFGQGRELSAHG